MGNLPPGHSPEQVKALVLDFLRKHLKATQFKSKDGRSAKIFTDDAKQYLYYADLWHNTSVEVWEFRNTSGKVKHLGVREVIFDWELPNGEKVARIKGLHWGKIITGGSHGDLDLAGSL